MLEHQPDIWDVSIPHSMQPRHTSDYQYSYFENAGADVSADTNYRVWSTNQNAYYYLPGAALQVDYKLTQSGGTAVTEAQQSALSSMGGWGLFEDVKLKFQGDVVTHVQKPGKVAFMNSLIEKGKNYIETVGENAHMFIDSVSDNAALVGTVRLAYTARDLGASTAVGTTPVSMVDKVQQIRTVVGGGCTNSAVTSVKDNPYYDPAMRRKVDRALAAGTGAQQLFLPLTDVFGIAQLDKVIRGTQIEIELNRISSTSEALFALLTDCVLTITRVRLWIPTLKPSLAAERRIESQIALNPKVTHTFDNYRFYKLPYNNEQQGEQMYSIMHTQNRPTKVFVGFQYALRDTSNNLNPCQFDLLGDAGANNLSKVELRVNGRSVPNHPYDPRTDQTRILQDIHRIGCKEIEDSACITKANWLSMFPIFAFDLEAIDNPNSSANATRSQANLELFWTTIGNVVNAGLASLTYNVIVVVVSEGSAQFDYTSGITAVRTV